MDENRKVCPPASGVPEQTRRSRTGLWIAAAAIFLAGLCTAGAAFILGRRGVWAVGGLLACAGLGVLLCLTIGRIRSRALRRAVAALALEVACVPVVYFGFYCIFLAKILPTVIGVVLLIVALPARSGADRRCRRVERPRREEERARRRAGSRLRHPAHTCGGGLYFDIQYGPVYSSVHVRRERNE